MNAWTLFTLIMLFIWLIVYAAKPGVRREMLFVSIYSAPFGFLEPLFVPKYWDPPSLFNLASTTGFDIESIFYCFATGGIASILYEVFFKVRHVKTAKCKNSKKRNSQTLIIASPFAFFILLFFAGINPIYASSISMFSGVALTIFFRPDLKKKIIVGGSLFLLLYFMYFQLFNLVFPGAVQRIWNLTHLSGIIFFGVPLEEMVFAMAFGMLWSSAYEYIKEYRLF